MKNRILRFCTAIVLLLAMACPVFASAELLPFDTMVTDNAGLLSDPEEVELNRRALELSQNYQCAVYIVTLPSLGGMEPWEATEYLWREYGMGYGSERSCVILMLSTEYRKYDIMAHGYGNTVFTDYGKDKMAEQFLDEFGEDDWYGGFTEYLDCCEQYLSLAAEGTPFDVGSDRSPMVGLAIGILVPLGVAFLVCSIFKAQMKTAKKQKAAQVYIDQQGLLLTGQKDRFTHTTRSKRYIEPPKESGGTTVNDSGSSHKSGTF